MHLALIRSAGVRYNAGFATIGTALLEKFPTGTPQVDREIARTLAYFGTPGAMARSSPR